LMIESKFTDLPNFNLPFIASQKNLFDDDSRISNTTPKEKLA
jgi:hypothetical protein